MRARMLLLSALALTVSCGGDGGDGGDSGVSSPPPSPPSLSIQVLYASVYTENAGVLTSGNIYAFSVDPASGTLSAVPGSPFASTEGASPIAISRDSKFLYSLNTSGRLLAFAINADGSLSAVPGAPFIPANGAIGAPAHILAHPTADLLLCSGPSSGIEVFTIDPASGALSLHDNVGGSAMVHSGGAAITPDGQYYFQGFDPSDGPQILVFSATTGIGGWGSRFQFADPNTVPGDLVIDPTGKFLYVLDIFDQNGVGQPTPAFSIDAATGSLTPVPGSPFGVPSYGFSKSAAIDSSGKFLIVSTGNDEFPGTNCLGVSSINGNTGALTAVPGSPFGTVCGVLAADPSGPYIYSGVSGSIIPYAIDPSSGALTALTSVEIPGTVYSIALTR
jgi:6-phosphogluconolactonase (cycloisomerase 2 family)